MKACPHCGALYHPNTIFCEMCGGALRALPSRRVTASTAGRAGSGPMRAVGIEILTSGRNVELTLTGDALVLGRADMESKVSPALDLSPDGGIECGVSRRHAQITMLSGQLLVEDLNSANGTWLNDVRLPPHQPFPVRHGDTLRLGRLTLRIRILTV